LTAEGQKRIFETENGTGLQMAVFFTLQGHFRFDEARPGVPLFSFAEIKYKKYGL
jgi:hypothetical protein